MQAIARDEVARIFECARCRDFVLRATRGAAGDHGEIVALALTDPVEPSRVFGPAGPGSSEHVCEACGRSVRVAGGRVEIEVVPRATLPAAPCARCRAVFCAVGPRVREGTVVRLPDASWAVVARALDGSGDRAACPDCGRLALREPERGDGWSVTLTMASSPVRRRQAPRIDCASCVAFVDRYADEAARVEQGALRVRTPADEPARSAGLGRLAIDDVSCAECGRRRRGYGGMSERVVLVDVDRSVGPAKVPGRGIEEAEAETIVACLRCRGWLREVAPAGFVISGDGATIDFRGGSSDLLAAHYGGEQPRRDRTCPDCRRQICLDVDTLFRVARNGPGHVEITPGALGPLAGACATCAPIVAEVARGPRAHLGDRVAAPSALRALIAARYRVSRNGGSARCDECGRSATFHAHEDLWLGLHAVPGAARARIPTLDCARCAAFVGSEEFPEVRGSMIYLFASPEPVYGEPPVRGVGRYAVTDWACPDCARRIAVEEGYNSWQTMIDIARPAKR